MAWQAGGGKWGTVPPDVFHGKCLLIGKKRLGKRGNGEEKKENCRAGGEQRTFFAFHFLKPLKLVWGLPEKKEYFAPGINREKWLCPPPPFAPPEKYSSYASAPLRWFIDGVGLNEYMCHGLKRYFALSTNEWHEIARTTIPPSFCRYLHMTHTKENLDRLSVCCST